MFQLVQLDYRLCLGAEPLDVFDDLHHAFHVPLAAADDNRVQALEILDLDGTEQAHIACFLSGLRPAGGRLARRGGTHGLFAIVITHVRRVPLAGHFRLIGWGVRGLFLAVCWLVCCGLAIAGKQRLLWLLARLPTQTKHAGDHAEAIVLIQGWRRGTFAVGLVDREQGIDHAAEVFAA